MSSSILFDPDNQALLIEGEYLQLAPKTFGVLDYLRRRPQTLVSKEELLEAVWPDVFVTEAVLKFTVGELRKLLGDNPKKPKYVQTIHRRGYRFIGDLPLAGGATANQTSTPEPVVIPPPDDDKLIGRQAQWVQLQQTWQLAQSGQPQILFLCAEAGLGKTTLLNSWLQQQTQADANCLIVTASCFDQHGNSEPYLPILEALGQLLRGPHAGQATTLLQQHAPGWLVQFPSLLPASESESLHRELFGATSQRMLREFADLIETFTRQVPLLLCIEDLHWCDTATVDLLVALANRKNGGRFMLLGTLRPSAAFTDGHPLKTAYANLTLHKQCRTLELPPLQKEDLATWLSPHLPEWLAVENCLELFWLYTQGNPLFVQATLDYLQQHALLADNNAQLDQEQALKLLEEGISGGLMQLLTIKIRHLDKTTLGLLEAASIPADECVTESLAAMLEQDVLDVEEACAAPSLEHWLAPQGERHWPDGSMAECYQFRHHLYRQFFYQRLSAARRRRYHLRFAERLLAGFQGNLGGVAAKLAYHFESGGNIPRSIEFHNQAGDIASQRFAYAEAIQHVYRVIELSKKSHQVDVCVTLAAKERRCLFLLATGKLQEVIADYQALIQASQQADTPLHELRATLGLADALFWVDRQACLQTCRSAVVLARRCEDDKWAIHAQGKFAHLQSMIEGYQAEHQAAYDAAMAMATADDGLEIKCIHYPRYVYYLSIRSEYAQALQVADQAKEFTRQAGDANSYLGCEFFRAWALFYQGKWGAMQAVIEQSLALAGKNEHHLWLAHFQLQQAWLRVHLHDREGARRLCLPIYEQSRQGPPGSLYFFSLIILILAGKADSGHYVEEITACLEQQPQTIDWVLKLSLFQSLTEYALDTGNYPQAQDYAQQLQTLAAASGEQTYSLLARYYQLHLAKIQPSNDNTATQATLTEALSALQQRDLPVVSWRLYALAEDWQAGTGVLRALLENLASKPELQTLFANATEVRRILDNQRL